MNSFLSRCTWCNADTGIFVLRIGLGVFFIMAGWMKVADLQGTVQMFASMNFGAIWAYIATFVELLGGIALILGILTRPAAILLTVVMFVATYVTRGNPMIVTTPAMFFFGSLAVAIAGSGRYTVLNWFKNENK